MRQVRQILKVTSVYVGTVIGAGFASGQEIIHFFTRYGTRGIYGLFVAGILFSVLGMMILDLIYTRRYTSYSELLNDLVGERIGRGLEGCVTLFLFVCLSAMFAGTGAMLNEQFGIPYQIGVWLMAAVVLVTLLSGAKGFIRMNAIIVPILCIGALLLGTYIIVYRDIAVISTERLISEGNWLRSSFIYVAYNAVTIIVVLCSIYPELKGRKIAVGSGLLGGMVLGGLGLSIGGSTLIYYSQINKLEIPILGVLLNYPAIYRYLYIILLLCAMYTTAIGNGYSIIAGISARKRWHKNNISIGVVVCGVVGANLGFSTIVSSVYPLFGYVGIFEILIIIVYYIHIKTKDKRRN